MKQLNEKRFLYLLNRSNKLRKEAAILKNELLNVIEKHDVLTVDEVLQIYKISRSTFDRYVKKGLKINQPCRNGRISVNRVELEKFLQKK